MDVTDDGSAHRRNGRTPGGGVASIDIHDAIITAEHLHRQAVMLRERIGPGEPEVALGCAVVSLRESVVRLRGLAASDDIQQL